MSREAGAAFVDDEPRCLPPVVPGQWGGAGTSPAQHLDETWAPPRQAGQQTRILKVAMQRILKAAMLVWNRKIIPVALDHMLIG